MELRNGKNLTLKTAVDIIKNSRITKLVDNPKFINRILSKKEIQIFNKIKNFQRRVEFLAGRFSAKESITKALNYKPNFNQIHIINNQVELPSNLKKKLNIKYITVSISHEREFTISNCIVLI